MCGFLPILFCVGRSMGQQMERNMDAQQKDFAKAAGVAEESLLGIRTVAAFAGEKREQNRFASQLMQARDGGINAGVKIGLAFGCFNFVFAMLYAVTLYVGGHGVLAGADNKNGGDVVTVLIALITGMGGVNSFSGYLPTMAKAMSSATAMKLRLISEWLSGLLQIVAKSHPANSPVFKRNSGCLTTPEESCHGGRGP